MWLRHSLATSLLRQGGSLDEIGELLRAPEPQHDGDLRQSRRHRLAHLGVAVAGVPMNPLAKGIRDYLALRRGLGFKAGSA